MVAALFEWLTLPLDPSDISSQFTVKRYFRCDLINEEEFEKRNHGVL